MVELIIIIVIVGIVGFIGWRVLFVQSSSTTSDSNTNSQNDTAAQPAPFMWMQTENGWVSQGTTPACGDQPFLKVPADSSKVTSVLYPGQVRGQYKPHGGLRFDTIKDNKVTVTAPFDGYIIKATRNFAEGTTEVQYGFDIMNNCGVATTLGHLAELPDKLKVIVDQLPPAGTDSRSHTINPPVYVRQGETLATKVGITTDKNTFFDWGVYDYRQPNEASKSAAYQAAHPQKDHAWYAVCWLKDWLPAADSARLVALPAGGGESGKKSDYCT